jgi:hypothetical protein
MPSHGEPVWLKSSDSFANGNCVEVAWVSADGCANGNCVEVAELPDAIVGVRNSRDPNGAVLRFTTDEWHAFIGGVLKGEFYKFGRQPKQEP